MQQDDLLEEETVIFVVSTTGSGTEPRSMKNLWDGLLNPLLPPDLFSEGPLLNFTVFALGDSSYEKFCWPGKMLARRLENLGAHEFCERGEGDEQHQLGWVRLSHHRPSLVYHYSYCVQE